MTEVMRGAALARDEQLEILRQMVRIRRFEERLALLFKRGKLPGFVHLYLGEEAVAVGVCSALRSDDRITSTHRGHGHLIAKGARVDRMMAELFGRVDGYCRGKGGSMHIVDFSLGIIGTNGIVGGGIPIGTGSAWGDKQLGRDNVTVTFFGDGASNQGVFFESMNLAAIWKLPVVFVCENNGYTEWTPTHRLTAGKIADRGAAMGIPGVQVDGNDVLAVRQATEEAVARARAGEGPSLIEASTYRWHGHNEGEEAFAGQYRPQDEQDEWRGREPIVRFRRYLVDTGAATEEELDRIDAEELAAVDAAVAFADASPFPDADEALAHLYADRTEGARS
ncbi:thiamine pyrophosphate-dependent dehydrogenase E1 component subunit alpha [Streptosporangium sp. NPDC051022]|uniref:thiamine pyrophosphate-dependent dehydrogenase E1 component subunit alpha n=1 Tax=Streptosporangium sp. NPDC051022 TaxID=3155752 RepID=UPI00341CFDA3